MKEANIGKDAIFIVGIIYSIIGGVFFILGIALSFVISDSQDKIVGIIFAVIGFIFLILGIVFLAIVHRKKQIANELISKGQHIIGEVVDYTRNFSIRINNKSPFVVIVKYVDSNSTSHIFKSRNIFHYPDKSILGKQVKIYISDETFRHYYVDIDEILPCVVEH